MRFSIIVPVYNSESFLSECIESVLHQSLQNFEMILIDDGSTDCSGSILDKYAALYSEKIKVFHKDNGGQFSARLKGIEMSSGDYIVPLDADDYLRKDALEILEDYILKTQNPDILFYGISVMADCTVPLMKYPFSDGELFEGISKQRLYEVLIEKPDLNPFCGKAYKSSLLKDVKWDAACISSIRNGEDLMQVLPLFTKAKIVIYCAHVLYFYRLSETSVTHRYSQSLFYSRKIIYAELKKYIKLWEMDEKIFGEILDKRFLQEMLSVMVNAVLAEEKTALDKLYEICNDNWFRDLYKRTDKRNLSYKGRIVLAIAFCRLTKILHFILRKFS